MFWRSMLTIAYSSVLSHPTPGTPFEAMGPHLTILRVLSLKTGEPMTINDDTNLD
jgi:hypothetical protein